jgi:hypothetical protein
MEDNEKRVIEIEEKKYWSTEKKKRGSGEKKLIRLIPCGNSSSPEVEPPRSESSEENEDK